jgi:anti-sigma-K factor RskA
MHGESDRLSRAGSYVLGLMGEADRERAEHDLEVDPAFREAVFKVAERLHRIELPRLDGGQADHWKHIAAHIADLPQMRGHAERPPAEVVPLSRAKPPVQDTRPASARQALVIAIALIAAFVAGYLAALARVM